MVATLNLDSIVRAWQEPTRGELLAKIRELGGSITLGDIRKWRPKWQGPMTPERMLRILARAGYGELTVKVGPKGGRPGLRFHLSDEETVHATLENHEIGEVARTSQ